MPSYQYVGANYEPVGVYRVWSKGSKTYAANERSKTSNPNSDRQAQFEQELTILAQQLGTRRLPVYVSWQNAFGKRMDWGCIGHAVASGFLQPLEDCEQGYVSHVVITEA